MPNEWLRERKRDQYHRLAVARGFRSRAAFKLIQINKRYYFIKRGQRVLDLGAAPGGWLQAARQAVGTRGFVFGVDKQPIEPLPFKNVVTLVADVADATPLAAEIRCKVGQLFDAVVSDLSPNLSGVWDLDSARQVELARCALRLSNDLLRPSGSMLIKVFQGSETPEFRVEMRHRFREMRVAKPPASRQESAELYFLGLGFLGDLAEH